VLLPTTVAVVGAATPVGRAVVARLADEVRVLAVDDAVDAAAVARPGVEVRVVDHRDRLLPLAVEGADVLVHCAFDDRLEAHPDTLYGANVGGTRRVLEAASKVGVAHLVVLSSAMAYGAHEDNPLPLGEDAPLRANPGFAPGYQRQLVEECVDGWAASHPGTAVTVLRTAPVLGGAVPTPALRRLQQPRLVVPAGQSAPWQVVHVDDVAAAVALVVRRRAAGTFNVAADGWLSDEEVAAAVGRRLLRVGREPLVALLRRSARIGLAPAPVEVLPLLQHPWVLDAGRLRDLGWRPTRTNREVLEEAAAAVAGTVALGTLVTTWRALAATAGAAVAAAVAAAALPVAALRRARRRTGTVAAGAGAPR
jgi:nucleoside-diphosphate-sugar epimerase